MNEEEFLVIVKKLWKKVKHFYYRIGYYKLSIFVIYIFILSASVPIPLFAPSQTLYIDYLKYSRIIKNYKPENIIEGEEYKYLKNSSAVEEAYKFMEYMKINEAIINKIPSEYRGTIIYYAYKENVPLDIIYYLIAYESNWYTNTIGKKNRNGSRDYGLMQLNSRYIKNFQKWFYTGVDKFNPFNPEHNIEIGIKYLKDLYLKTYNWKLAVTAYNCGIYGVYRNKIPKSTVRYVKIIFSNIKKFNKKS